MQSNRAELLSGIVAALSEYINVVRSCHLPETAVLLDMAKLDLQMKIHSISDLELQALCDALEGRRASSGGGAERRDIAIGVRDGAPGRGTETWPSAPASGDIILLGSSRLLASGERRPKRGRRLAKRPRTHA